MEEIAPGLRRWTAWHEEWEEEVGSLAVDTVDGLVLIDPLDPPRDVMKPDHIFVTVFWHERAAKQLGAKRVWGPLAIGAAVEKPWRRRDRSVPCRRRASRRHPRLQTARPAEVVYWLPAARAVAVGDVLLGAGAKPRPTSAPLRLCPKRWLWKATHDDLCASLRPLLDLPVEHVLVSHGEPVLQDGKRALAAILGR